MGYNLNLKVQTIQIIQSRRTVIVLIYLVFSCCTAFAQNIPVNTHSTIQFLLAHQKPNGAFGPADMDYTDVAWTYPAVQALKTLGVSIPNPDSCYHNGHQPWIEKASWKNGPWYWSLHQKANLYRLMDRDGELEAGMSPGMELEIVFKKRTNYTEFRDYVKGEFYDITTLWYIIEAIGYLNGNITNPEYAQQFILARQTTQGGFEDLLDDRKESTPERAHVLVTCHAVLALQALNLPVPHKEKIVDWLRSLQDSTGGFKWNPNAESTSNLPDVWYTWAAVRTLKALGSEPTDPVACLRWLNSLQNADGGFGDRPGWDSRLYSTCYAVQTLEMLTGKPGQAIIAKEFPATFHDTIPEGVYSIFQAHHKSPVGGAEMVDAIADMGINLIAVKTTEKTLYESNGVTEVVQQAREYARDQNYPLEIVDAPENYSHQLVWFSGMDGNHVSNYMIPPDISNAHWPGLVIAHEAGKKGLPWKQFKSEVIDPVSDIGNLFYPELDYTMTNAYMVYDEGISGVGYTAVPAAHFGNYDWVRHFPYKERWVGQLPMIADGDAHADIDKWRKNLESFRNVFIAKSYHYYDYIDASQNGRSVCVIRMPTGAVRYYGSKAAVVYLKKHIKTWKWWK